MVSVISERIMLCSFIHNWTLNVVICWCLIAVCWCTYSVAWCHQSFSWLSARLLLFSTFNCFCLFLTCQLLFKWWLVSCCSHGCSTSLVTTLHGSIPSIFQSDPLFPMLLFIKQQQWSQNAAFTTKVKVYHYVWFLQQTWWWTPCDGKQHFSNISCNISWPAARWTNHLINRIWITNSFISSRHSALRN